MGVSPDVWDVEFGNGRSAGEWERLFFALRDSLSEYLGLQIHVEEWSTEDSDDAKHSWVGGNIRVSVSDQINLHLIGCLGLSVNHGERAYVFASLLLFLGGVRMVEHPLRKSPCPHEALWLEFRPTPNAVGKWSHCLVADEAGEWESFLSFSDWGDRVKSQVDSDD